MLLDVHTHAFHPKIAHKVLAQLNGHYGIEPMGDGTPDDLLTRLRAAGLDGAVVHTAATDPSQVIPANAWSRELSAAHPELICFGAMHPDFPDPATEFDRLAEAGVRGLKFHADFQGFRLDDPRLYRLLELAGDRFVVMFHVGDTLPPGENPSCPYTMRDLVRAFPDTPMIAAHLGGYLHWPHAAEVLAGERVYLDTSSSLDFIEDAVLRDIFRRHPRERILFGSDYPLFDPAREADKLCRRLGLSSAGLEEMQAAASALLAA
ncbi:amidohydrolase family protein [Desulfohalovibrio reitneri]|uniref:amidohydrolase family protein n=1 Tax=Desulfohalovibrio reitneri TaxID=1307759 RepID=UPI0004A7121B|nr:amidohydrolase family protein [Desulfohalovibrio reitneri]